MPRRRKERRVKQVGEIIHFETNKQYVMVTPNEFAKIVGKPGLTVYRRGEKEVYRVGNDKEIVVKHMGRRAVVFEDRRMQTGRVGARIKPSIRPGKETIEPELPDIVRRKLKLRHLPKEAADQIVDSMKRTKGRKK